MLFILAVAVILLPSSQDQKDQSNFELNTVLKQSTFKIEGRTAQGQPTLGIAFIIGRPYPNHVPKARYVLITATHVQDEMAGDVAVVDFRCTIRMDEAPREALPAAITRTWRI